MKTSYSLIVFEIEDIVPRRDSSKPNLFVSITAMPVADRLEFFKSGRGPDWLVGNVRMFRPDLSRVDFTKHHDDAKSYKSRAVMTLKSEGYTVNRNTDLWRVYVIELDPTAVQDPGQGYVYVGETKKTPEQRFAEHMSRSTNSKTRLYSTVVANFGKHLRMDLAPKTYLYDKASSIHAEAVWAEHLRSLGYVVRGGH